MKIKPGYETWSELDLATGVIVGEASGEPTAGKIGVIITVKSRVEQPCWWGRNWREVILCASQFSCWDDHNVSRIVSARQEQGALWQLCRAIAIDAYMGRIEDHIGKPTHYHANPMPGNRPFPAWAKKLARLTQIGGHIFYR